MNPQPFITMKFPADSTFYKIQLLALIVRNLKYINQTLDALIFLIEFE